MANKLANDETQIIPFEHYTYSLKLLDTKLNHSTNQNSIKVPNLVKPTNKKNIIIKLWEIVHNKQPTVPSLPGNFTFQFLHTPEGDLTIYLENSKIK